MKKMFTLMMVVSVVILASCDEDTEVAYQLEGEWEGDMGMCYVYEDYDRYGSYTTQYNAQYTNIRFFRNTMTSGYGDQVDFYPAGPYAWRSFSFRWQVRNGNVYIDYDYDDELDCVIYDYYIDYYHFGGRIGGTRFSLDKLDDFKWSDYGYIDDGYGYGYYPYSKTRGAETDSISKGHIVKSGSCYAEGMNAE